MLEREQRLLDTEKGIIRYYAQVVEEVFKESPGRFADAKLSVDRRDAFYRIGTQDHKYPDNLHHTFAIFGEDRRILGVNVTNRLGDVLIGVTRPDGASLYKGSIHSYDVSIIVMNLDSPSYIECSPAHYDSKLNPPSTVGETYPSRAAKKVLLQQLVNNYGS